MLKLKTMLLPTGKFILVGEFDSDHEPLDEAQKETFAGLRKDVGAVTAFLTNEKVKVQDAVIQPGAVEHVWDDDEEEDQEGDYECEDCRPVERLLKPQPQFDFGKWFADLMEQPPYKPDLRFHPGGLVEGPSFPAPEHPEPGVVYAAGRENETAVDDEDDSQLQETWKLVQDGAKLTPAGLIKLTPEQKAERGPAELEPELAAALAERPEGLKVDLSGMEFRPLQAEPGTEDITTSDVEVQEHHFPPTGHVFHQLQGNVEFYPTGRRTSDHLPSGIAVDLNLPQPVVPLAGQQCPCYPHERLTVDPSCDNCPLERVGADLAVGDRVRVKVEDSLLNTPLSVSAVFVVSELEESHPANDGGPVVWVADSAGGGEYVVRPEDVERI